MKTNTKTLLAVVACAFIFTFQPPAFAVELDSLIVTDSGNVGIGTTTPSSKLTINGSGIWDGGTLTLNNSGAGGQAWTIFSTNSSFSQGAGNLLFYRNWADGAGGTLTLKSNGSVGIGTCNPMRQLHIASPTVSSEMILEVADGAADARKWNIFVAGGTGNPQGLLFRRLNDAGTGGPIDFVINGSGNVGIGATNPRVTIDVPNNLDVQGGIYVGKTGVYNGTINTDDSLFINIDANNNQANSRFQVGTNANNSTGGSAPLLTVLETGNVGIGTASPSAKLQINSLANDTPSVSNSNLFLRGSNQGYGLAVGTRMTWPGGTWLQSMVNDQPGDVPILLNPNSGNVGIGTTTPTAKLDVNGNSKLTGTLTVSSNVGIGTTSPTTKLDVNGNSKITGNLEVTQTITANNLILPPGPIAPDYVFEPDYKLPSLAEVAAYVKENRHLPEVPSAKEMEAQGLNMTTQMMTHLRKIEELTLYMIDLKSENNEIKSANDDLKSTNDQLKASNDEMRSLVQDLAARLAAIETARDAKAENN